MKPIKRPRVTLPDDPSVALTELQQLRQQWMLEGLQVGAPSDGSSGGRVGQQCTDLSQSRPSNKSSSPKNLQPNPKGTAFIVELVRVSIISALHFAIVPQGQGTTEDIIVALSGANIAPNAVNSVLNLISSSREKIIECSVSDEFEIHCQLGRDIAMMYAKYAGNFDEVGLPILREGVLQKGGQVITISALLEVIITTSPSCLEDLAQNFGVEFRFIYDLKLKIDELTSKFQGDFSMVEPLVEEQQNPPAVEQLARPASGRLTYNRPAPEAGGGGVRRAVQQQSIVNQQNTPVALTNITANIAAAAKSKSTKHDKKWLENLELLKPCMKADGTIDYTSLDEEVVKKVKAFVKDQRKCYRKRESLIPSAMTDERYRLLSEAKFNFKPTKSGKYSTDVSLQNTPVAAGGGLRRGVQSTGGIQQQQQQPQQQQIMDNNTSTMQKQLDLLQLLQQQHQVSQQNTPVTAGGGLRRGAQQQSIVSSQQSTPVASLSFEKSGTAIDDVSVLGMQGSATVVQRADTHERRGAVVSLIGHNDSIPSASASRRESGTPSLNRRLTNDANTPSTSNNRVLSAANDMPPPPAKTFTITPQQPKASSQQNDKEQLSAVLTELARYMSVAGGKLQSTIMIGDITGALDIASKLEEASKVVSGKCTERAGEMEKLLEKQSSDINTLQKSFAGCIKQNHRLLASHTSLENGNKSLEMKIDDANKRNAILLNEIDTLKKRNATLETAVTLETTVMDECEMAVLKGSMNAGDAEGEECFLPDYSRYLNSDGSVLPDLNSDDLNTQPGYGTGNSNGSVLPHFTGFS